MPENNLEGQNLQRGVSVPVSAVVSSRLVGVSPEIQEAFDSLESMNNRIELSHIQEGESLWYQPEKIDALVHPVTSRFLSLPISNCEPVVHASQSQSLSLSPLPVWTWTCLRSGALLYLAEFRRRSGISPVNTEIHARHLCLGLKKCGSEDGALLDLSLQLWLLTIVTIEGSELVSFEEYGELTRKLTETLNKMGITSLIQWQNSLREIIWFEALFKHQLRFVAGGLSDVPFLGHLT